MIFLFYHLFKVVNFINLFFYAFSAFSTITFLWSEKRVGVGGVILCVYWGGEGGGVEVVGKG